MRLILTFAVCIVAGLIVYAVTKPIFETQNMSAEIHYEGGMDEIDNVARESVMPVINQYNQDLKTALGNPKTTKAGEGAVTGSSPQEVEIIDGSIHNEKEYIKNLQEFIDQQGKNYEKKIMIIDMDGKVLYKSSNTAETQVDIRTLIGQAMEARSHYSGISYSGDSHPMIEYSSFIPIELYNNQKVFLIVTGAPRPNIVYNNFSTTPILLPILPGLITFFVLFYFLTKRKMNQIGELSAGLREIATGNLQHRVKEGSQDEIGSLAVNINHMASELQLKIEEERQAEKVKNELITNVSHDLRTPLTTIMGYLRLVLDHKYESDEQMEEYVKVTYGKSEKLKRLIDDLFEYTKLTSPGVRLHRREVCMNELVDQLVEEAVPLSEENGLVFVKEMTHERIIVDVDADKIVRVIDNLLTNAITYSNKPREIRVRLDSLEQKAIVQIDNYCDTLTDEDVPRLFERFYRADQSRSASGGSGLGLAIAKSIIELHGGDIWAHKEGNFIRFSFTLPL
ncbi:sensor histidine kinase [Brevibacillus ginsengisoli]|uniref:sensor histidine kinase n=1 Tax=Brevibacillus ginsengisoli TaxID=363854 RepID=UPI003CEE25E4